MFGAILVSISIMLGAFIMSEGLNRIVREVAEMRGVAASAVLALSSVPQLIRDAVTAAVGDAAALESKLNELADQLDATQADLAGAINANPGPADPGGDTVSGEGDETIGGGEGEDTVSG